MKIKRLAVALCVLAAAAFAAKDYGRLRVTRDGAVIYHGADLNSKKEARAKSGDEFVLRDDGLIHGFYKIEYRGHVSFIHAGDVRLLDDGPEPTPASKPTPAPPPSTGSGPAKAPTRAVAPTEEPTARPAQEDEEAQTRIPTKAPTREAAPTRVAAPTAPPTPRPTPVVTREPEHEPEPTRAPTDEPTSAPTPRPMSVVTRESNHKPEPTRGPIDEPTAAPTPRPTPAPTREVVRQAEPTPAPTREVVRQAEPTPAPTREVVRQAEPTPAPTRQIVRQAEPTPVPGPVVGRGRRLRDPGAVGRTVQRSVEAGALLAGVLSTRRRSVEAPAKLVYGPQRPQPQRPRDKLSDAAFFVPLGGGPCVPVQPAFKPSAASPDVRCIDSATFIGIGGEGRTRARWLRIFGDWTVHQHSTLAANLSRTATAVGVPGVATILFPESDVQYTMSTHGLRLGLKASLPFPIVEPWIGGGLGAYYWKAEYIDSQRSIVYGDDQGWAFGATALAGIDFSIPTSWGLFVLTPFAEYGTPTVYPQVADIAGTGARWKDTYGTPVMMPWRFGLGLGIGF